MNGSQLSAQNPPENSSSPAMTRVTHEAVTQALPGLQKFTGTFTTEVLLGKIKTTIRSLVRVEKDFKIETKNREISTTYIVVRK